MKFKSFLQFAVLITLFSGAGWAVSGEKPSAGNPAAVVAERHYVFHDMVEGAKVRHEFTIGNRGQGVLEIKKVKTG